MKKKILATVAAGAVALGTAVLVAPSAQAAQRNGVCESGEVCLYYNSGMTGSMVDLASNVALRHEPGCGGEGSGDTPVLK